MPDQPRQRGGRSCRDFPRRRPVTVDCHAAGLGSSITAGKSIASPGVRIIGHDSWALGAIAACVRPICSPGLLPTLPPASQSGILLACPAQALKGRQRHDRRCEPAPESHGTPLPADSLSKPPAPFIASCDAIVLSPGPDTPLPKTWFALIPLSPLFFQDGCAVMQPHSALSCAQGH